MTERLYYQDPFLADFTARVLSCREEKDSWAITLDRTAFYPEGGGQSADQGTLGPVRVTDTRDRDGEVVHICHGPLPVGSTVTGQVDFSRRFDLMQQHSGEHIVSGIICSRFHCNNVGFHIGHDLVTIDFDAEMTMEDLRQVEREANDYIFADHPISITHPSAQELALLPYRSKKELTGDVRIVTWPGADCCACCGTHVLRSGQVGMVKLFSCQKFREGVRIEMAAGGRAINYLTTMLDQNTRVSQLLSAKPGETAQAVERLQKQLAAAQSRAMTLEEQYALRKAKELDSTGDVLLFEGEMTSDALRRLCDTVMTACGGRCAVFAGSEGTFKYAIGHSGGDLRSLTKALNAVLNGRGGGKPNFVQGSVQAQEADIRAFFQNS